MSNLRSSKGSKPCHWPTKLIKMTIDPCRAYDVLSTKGVAIFPAYLLDAILPHFLVHRHCVHWPNGRRS